MLRAALGLTTALILKTAVGAISRVAGVRRSKGPEPVVGARRGRGASIGMARRSRCPGSTGMLRRHGGGVIFAASRAGRDRRTAAEITRPGGRSDGGAPVIRRSKVAAILTCRLLVLRLRGQRGGVLLAAGSFFLRRRAHLNAAASTVIAGGGRVVDDYRFVVDMGHVGDAHVGHRPVVEETSAAPLAPGKAHAPVTEPVVDAAVEADVRTPISGVPRVKSPAPAPIAGRPKLPNRSNYPGSRNPVITAVIVPGPVPWSPDKTGAGADGLRVNGKCRRADPHRNADRNLRRRSGSERQTDDCQKQPSNHHSLVFHRRLLPRWPERFAASPIVTQKAGIGLITFLGYKP